MNSTMTEYGFDASFISDVPDYLKCVVCHLVLRNPIQIMRCGHRFCATCFERIKGYAEHMSTELLCPIDREKVELDKVFEDTGIARVIGNLSVKCHNYINGCIWTGDLRDLEAHYLDCGCNQISHPEPEKENVLSILENLSSRMNAFEDFRLKSEKETALLKYTLHEFKTKSAHKEAELVGLKAKLASLEHDLFVVKETNKELKNSHKREIENMSLKGQLMEVKVESLQSQIKELHGMMDEKVNILLSQLNNIKIKRNIEGNDSENLNELMSNIGLNATPLENGGKNSKNSKPKKTKKLTGSVEVKSIEQLHSIVTDLREKVNAKINVLSEQTIEALTKVQNFDRIKTNTDTIQHSNNVESLDEVKDQIIKIASHITNIENIIFCDSSKGNMNIVLKWKLHNFESHDKSGSYVYSPTFCTQFRGYCFQLYANISPEKIGIYLTLCRAGANNLEVLEPFNMPYKLEIMDTSGKKIESQIQLAEIEKNRLRYFTIPPEEIKVKGGFGYSFHAKDLNVKDMLFVKCIIMPSI